eukprot:TRINITY_DN113147_c0_g1_i1.p1 TRINITY_DN113147_c0_g1~~TRINITY_DN113147_c0_g1_i1.p1  ORF type:complete len:307 (-),score=17.95 TRINITY_DN113147_c0_g1_i1:273-1148(-)
MGANLQHHMCDQLQAQLGPTSTAAVAPPPDQHVDAPQATKRIPSEATQDQSSPANDPTEANDAEFWSPKKKCTRCLRSYRKHVIEEHMSRFCRGCPTRFMPCCGIRDEYEQLKNKRVVGPMQTKCPSCDTIFPTALYGNHCKACQPAATTTTAYKAPPPPKYNSTAKRVPAAGFAWWMNPRPDAPRKSAAEQKARREKQQTSMRQSLKATRTFMKQQSKFHKLVQRTIPGQQAATTSPFNAQPLVTWIHLPPFTGGLTYHQYCPVKKTATSQLELELQRMMAQNEALKALM